MPLPLGSFGSGDHDRHHHQDIDGEIGHHAAHGGDDDDGAVGAPRSGDRLGVAAVVERALRREHSLTDAGDLFDRVPQVEAVGEEGEDDAHGAARAGPELGDEVGVGRVVERCDKHAYYRRNGKRNNERPDWSLRHA